jgi:LPXTG-motif cell wall-anchored protein
MVATPQGGYAATTAPTIAGYTPDQTSVAADNPVAMTTLPEDSSATISYTADPQILTINYVDGATGKTVATDTVPGTTDEAVNYTADKVPANYVLANGQGTTGTQTLTADPAKNVATIKVVPAVTHSTQVTTQTVNYVLAGTTTALKTPTTQQITWNISTDQVTGDIIATPQGGYAATTAPTIAGYTPDQTSVAADNPAAMTTLPADSSATISYTADPQTLTVAYIDDVTGATISTDTATGVTDQTGTYTVTVPANYELATGQADTVAYTLNADSAKNNVEVHLTHHISHTTTTTTRTINYLVKGSDAQVTDPDVQTITWNVSTDDVTNASVATPQDGYAEVTAPTITGYTADTPVVAAENPAPTSADQLAGETVNVYYILTETDDNGEGDNGTPSQPTDEGTTTPTDTNNGQITVPTKTGTPSGTQAVKVTGTQQTKATANKLPQTDEKANSMALIGLGLMSFMSFMGLARTKKHD